MYLARRPICSSSRTGSSSTKPIALRVLIELRSTSGSSGSAHPSCIDHRKPPSAPSTRSRHNASPVFVDVGMKASRLIALRIVHGTDISTTTLSGIAATTSALRQPYPATRPATRAARMNQIENGRTRTETPSSAPNSRRRLVLGGPSVQSWVTSTQRAARHQKMNIVSSCRLPTWNTRFGNTARRPAVISPARWPNMRRAMT